MLPNQDILKLGRRVVKHFHARKVFRRTTTYWGQWNVGRFWYLVLRTSTKRKTMTKQKQQVKIAEAICLDADADFTDLSKSH
jgi:hypothetical protein